jgi:hypothetical protein
MFVALVDSVDLAVLMGLVPNDRVVPGFLEEVFTTGTEFAEIGEFFNQELSTPRPPRLRGAISESCSQETLKIQR